MNATLMQNPIASTSTSARDYVPAMMASFLGWTLDAFDFFLVVFCLTAIAKEFRQPDAAMALSITVTLALRPLGAFIFGLLADRFGRRKPLIMVLVFYSIVEALTGFATSYAWFLALRALFGVGMGGEWGVGASLAMEKVPPRLRGFLSGLLQQGYAAGYLLASICYFFFFQRWGWRPLFFLGGLPALLAVFVRFYIKESEVWERTRSKDWGELRRTILANWKLLAALTCLMMGMTLASHGTQDLYPTFLERQWHLGPSARALVTGISMVGGMLGGVLFGLLSDGIGRRRAMIVGLGGASVLIPLWAFPPSLVAATVGALLIQFMVLGAWGIVPAHLSELSPDQVRGFLPGFAYQCGVLMASSITYLEALLAQRTGYMTAMSLTAVLAFSFAILMIAMSKEHRAVRFRGQE